MLSQPSSDAEMKFTAHLSEVNDLCEWDFSVLWFMKKEHTFCDWDSLVATQVFNAFAFVECSHTFLYIFDFIHFGDVHKSSRLVF